MTKEAVISKEDQEYIDSQIKRQAGPSFNIKKVDINSDTVDENGKEIKPNTFRISETDVYAKTIKVRPVGWYGKFINTIQVTENGKQKWRAASESILFQPGEEAIDTIGSINCGKVSSKSIPAHWSEAEKLANRNKAKYFGFIYGIFEFPGQEPFLGFIRLPTAKAVQVSEALSWNNIKKGEDMASFSLTMTLGAKKGVKYPELTVELDKSNPRPLHEIIGAHKEVRSYVNFHNDKIKKVRSQVEAARKFKADDAATVQDIFAELEGGLDDE